MDDYFFSTEPSTVPCVLCRGVVFEFSVPSELWNAVVRRGGPETDKEYLCVNCFHRKVYEAIQPELFGTKGGQ